MNALALALALLAAGQPPDPHATGAVPPANLATLARAQNTRAASAIRAAHAAQAADRTPRPDPNATAHDWRTLGLSNPVRAQANCGSCWAFGTVAVLETAAQLQTGDALDLSEQDVLSCSRAGSCSGGWWAYDYAAKKGLALETAWPYKAKNLACRSNLERTARPTSWAYVHPSGQIPTDAAMKRALCEFGPLGICIRANSALSNYRPGAIWKSPRGSINHIVTLIGWNDDKKAWLIRNSWGHTWGDKGHFWCAYGSNVGYGATYAIYD